MTPLIVRRVEGAGERTERLYPAALVSALFLCGSLFIFQNFRKKPAFPTLSDVQTSQPLKVLMDKQTPKLRAKLAFRDAYLALDRRILVRLSRPSEPFPEALEPVTYTGLRVGVSRFVTKFAAASFMPKGWPAEGIPASSYGWRISPFSRRLQFHHGVDITNSIGTPVCATAPGTVVFSGWKNGYGYVVIVEHDQDYSSHYAHNSEIWAKRGRRVLRGEILAFMGSSGRSTASHLHYEVWRKGKSINPWAFMGGDPRTMAKSRSFSAPARAARASRAYQT